MKTIIVINDNSTEALHAAVLALDIAEKVGADILITNEVKDQVLIATDGEIKNSAMDDSDLPGRLRLLYDANADFIPAIKEMDISGFRDEDLARLVISNNVWLMVAGTRELSEQRTNDPHINIQSVLNHVRCPLLLVPEKSNLRGFRQMIYLADLRYCRLHVVRFLAELAMPYQADIFVDHLSAKGLPHMEENYALRVFNEQIAANVNYSQLFFNNIRERDMNRAVDVMINGMHADLLVMVNHRFHFEEILGKYITHMLPANMSVPILIFPY